MTPGSDGYEFEILIKSFIRFDRLERLVKSITRYYPGVCMQIADDSPDSPERERIAKCLGAVDNCHFHELPFNIGVSAGRNYLLGKVKTPYFFLCDDDKVFTARTSLEKLRIVLENDPQCLLAAGVVAWSMAVSTFPGMEQFIARVIC